MAITREQFERITQAIEMIIGDDKPIMIVADTSTDIHVLVFSGEVELPGNIYMSAALSNLATRHAMQTMDHYKEWLLKQAQSSGQVLPTAKETM